MSPRTVSTAASVTDDPCPPASPDQCSAEYIPDESQHHYCAQDPGHADGHVCSCGTGWDETVIPHDPDECGVSRDAGFGHQCVCHLAVHNTVPVGTVNLPLHACASCGQPWTV